MPPSANGPSSCDRGPADAAHDPLGGRLDVDAGDGAGLDAVGQQVHADIKALPALRRPSCT